MKMGVVADDVTGSNDIGIMFAKSGLEAHVYSYTQAGDYTRQVLPAGVPAPDIAILDTNSRLDSARLAYDKVFAATRELRAAGCQQFFNKTCSVFRGNIGAEFDAMLDALEQDFAVVVLGFPKNGRRTVDGIHYVHGKPLAESEFRDDPIHPMRQSNLVDILQAQTPRRVGLVPHTVVAQGPAALRAEIEARRGQQQYVIVDVVDQAALRTIAAAVQDVPVLCGSSALAEELPAAWGMVRERSGTLDLPRPAGLGALCVAGSLMPQTAAQLRHVVERGAAAFQLNGACVFEPEARQGEIGRLARASQQALGSGRDVVVHSANDPAEVAATRALGAQRGLSATETARLVSESLAEVAAAVLAASGQNRLVVAGGETSAAVCRRLGVTGMRIWQELQPGLPSCISLTEPALLLVLKSGSFGSPEFIAQALEHVRTQ